MLNSATALPQSIQKVRRTYVWMVAIVAAISGFLFGFDTAVINGALIFLRRQFGLSNLQTEIAASSLLLGCLIGAAIASVLSDRFGRRKSLMFAAILFTASAASSALAGSIMIFSYARLAGGLAIGLASALTPIYISEIAPYRNRGLLVSLNQLAIVIGILIAYLTNWQLAGLDQASWRWMFAVAAIPSVAFLIGLLFIPESPRWLITHGQRQQGYAVLARIVGEDEAHTELVAIESAAVEESASAVELFSPGMRIRVYIAVSLAVLSQVSGINTVLYYGSVLFTEHFHGESAKAAIGANVAIGLVNLLCTVVAMIFIDRWGRRGLLLVSSGGMAVSLAVLSVGLHEAVVAPVVIFGSVLLYVAFFAVGIGPGVWVYTAEIFPTRMRGRATSLATTALWTACLGVTLSFLSIVQALGAPAAFMLYAILSSVTFLFVWKWVPETRGRSLEAIQHMWGQ
ncbi:MAG TPA: sugar porter family MFS transporter [Acidobacteriaceae bacterium]